MTKSLYSVLAAAKGTVLIAAASFLAALVLLSWPPRISVSSAPVYAQSLQPPSACDAAVPNPLAVATLRWYVRNQVARFPLQGGAGSMAFDGANMYILTSANSQFVIDKMRASDGALTATFSNFGTLEFSNFGPLLFDGQNIWLQYLASDAAGAVKLRASDGALLDTFTVGSPVQLGGMTFDGQDIWIAIRGSGVVRFRANNIQQSQTFSGGDPVGLASDGHNVWVADTAGVVTVRRNSDGAVVHSIPMPGEPWAIAFDGANMWVSNVANNTVTKIRVHDFAPVGTFATQSGPLNMVFDGASIWVANTNSNNVTQLRACDGSLLGTFAPGGNPGALAFDGINVWVGLGNGVAKM
jgi:hypothetical protein